MKYHVIQFICSGPIKEEFPVQLKNYCLCRRIHLRLTVIEYDDQLEVKCTALCRDLDQADNFRSAIAQLLGADIHEC